MPRNPHGLDAINRMSVEDYRREVGQAQRHVGDNPLKYRNKPTVYDSPLVSEMTYPSKRQMERAKALDLLWRGGEILWWLPEIPIRLKAHTETRQRIMRVDFLICWKDGTVTWEDAKGVETKEWSLKRDLVAAQYGITVETV